MKNSNDYRTIKLRFRAKSLAINLLVPIFLFALLAKPSANAGPVEIRDPLTLVTTLEELSQRYTSGKILVVTDLDNTLLELDNDIGSEHWFLWQKSLIDQRLTTEAVAKDVAGLLSLQTLISSLSSAHLVSSEMHGIYNQFSRNGHHIIGLTSRMIETRDMTIRELRRNGLQFINKNVRVAFVNQPGSAEGAGLIFDEKNPRSAGLTRDALQKQKVTASKPVAWSHGVLFTEGQNKGVMLASFLHRTGLASSIKAIVFLDDRIHHVQAVDEVLADLYPEIERLSVNLTISRAKVASFEKSDKTKAKTDFCKFLPALKSLWRTDSTFPVSSHFTSCR